MPYEIDGIDLSNYTIDQLNALVDMAQAEIEHKQRARIDDVRQQIEDLAAATGMSLDDLLAMKPGSGRKKSNGKIAAAAKYRNPNDSTQTWSGRGKRPQWFKELVESGYEPEELAAA